MKLLAVGTVALTVETFGKRDDILGGSVNYLGTSASYFTEFWSVIGEDFPEEILKLSKVRDRHRRREKIARKTFRWRGHYMTTSMRPRRSRLSLMYSRRLIPLCRLISASPKISF